MGTRLGLLDLLPSLASPVHQVLETWSIQSSGRSRNQGERVGWCWGHVPYAPVPAQPAAGLRLGALQSAPSQLSQGHVLPAPLAPPGLSHV